MEVQYAVLNDDKKWYMYICYLLVFIAATDVHCAVRGSNLSTLLRHEAPS